MSDFSDEEQQNGTPTPTMGQPQQEQQNGTPTPTMGQPQQPMSILEQMNSMMSAFMQQQMQMTERLIREMRESSGGGGSGGGSGGGNSDKTQRRPHENRLEPKSFHRMEQYIGGEGLYKDWSFDVLQTAESVCPGFNKMIQTYMEGKVTGWQTSYSDFDLEHAELRAKEFYSLLCVLTAGEAKLLIRDCGDGLEAWHTLWATYNRKTLARSLRMYKSHNPEISNPCRRGYYPYNRVGSKGQRPK